MIGMQSGYSGFTGTVQYFEFATKLLLRSVRICTKSTTFHCKTAERTLESESIPIDKKNVFGTHRTQNAAAARRGRDSDCSKHGHNTEAVTMNSTPTKNTPGSPCDPINPVFQPVSRETITNGSDPYEPVTVVDAQRRMMVEGTLFSIAIAATLQNLQVQLTQQNNRITQQNDHITQLNNRITQQNDRITQLNNRITRLESEVEQLKCPICLVNRKNARVFCGHLFCDRCLNGRLLCSQAEE